MKALKEAAATIFVMACLITATTLMVLAPIGPLSALVMVFIMCLGSMATIWMM